MAIGFIALYAVCVFAPTAALAFNSASCLSDEQGQSQTHKHAGDAQQHGDHDHTAPADTQDDGSGIKCCGAMFLSALAPDLNLALGPAALSGSASFAVMQNFTGLPPDELIRPPKFQS